MTIPHLRDREQHAKKLPIHEPTLNVVRVATLLALCFTAFTTTAAIVTDRSASGASSTLRVEDLKPKSSTPAPENGREGEDADTIITNKKMRTDSGSKSRYSISTATTYSGGSLLQPFGTKRPNIADASGNTPFTSIDGSVSGKYNINVRNALMGGASVRWVAPLAGGETPAGYNGNRVDMENPYLIYQYLYRLGGLQSYVQVRQTYISVSDLQRIGYLTTGGITQTSVYELGRSGFSFGFTTYVGYGFFDSDTAEHKAMQSDYSWAFSPAVQYRISDRWQLHMDSNLLLFEHMRSQADPWTFRRQVVTQNLGLSYSLTRDVYISPAVSFTLTNLALAGTTWSITAAMNLF